MAIYPPTTYRQLTTTAGGVDEFMTFFKNLKKHWVKVEFLQEYDESGSPGYDAFRNGDHEKAATLVRELVHNQREIYDHAADYDITMTRIRVYELPLSPYLRHYEFAAYLADIECGEDVRVIDEADIRPLLDETGISDFVLFDRERVIALIYDLSAGTLREARLVEDPELVSAYAALADELIEQSTPLLHSSIYQNSR